MIAGHGDDLPVSALPVGVIPDRHCAVGEAKYSQKIPVWDNNSVSNVENVSWSVPHAVIRAKVYDASLLGGAPATFEGKVALA